jgi:thiol-disulfide isomerase/thioredoxin
MTTHYTVFALAFLLVASLASAQNVDPALRPPKGAQVALVVFEDLQCPDCRRAAPLVEEAARTYKIPVVRHDFPLPMHNWSYDAAIIARYFDTQSKELGNEFRDYIFQHQPEITPPTLRGFAEKFAADHKVELTSWSIRKASWPQPSIRTRTRASASASITPQPSMWSATRRRANPSSKWWTAPSCSS